MEVRIDGNAVSNEQDIHRQLAAQLELGDGYGYNTTWRHSATAC